MAGEIASAFVRIRPNLSGFKGEAEAGIKSAMRGLAGTGVPGLTRANEQLALFSGYQRKAAESAVVSSRIVRSAREQEARATVASTLVERRALQETLVQYRRLAASAKLSADSRQVANVKAAETAALLGAPLSKAEHHARSARGELGKLERGAVAGSGVFKGLGRNIAYSSGAFIGAYGLIGVIKKAITSQGEFLNQQTRTTTIFRSSASAVLAWSKTTARSLGLARTSALDTAASFGTVFEAAGIAPGQAARFSESLTKVGAAISLAHGDEDPARANKALIQGLSGRGRALREYGIILDQTTIQAKAAELGLVKTTADPTKVLLAERRLGEAQAKLALDRADPKKSPLQISKDQSAVIAAHAKLQKEIAGTTGPLSNQAKALAAQAIITEQSKRAVDRYAISLNTAAGRSRKFHEAVDEVSGEVGHELYPSFKRIQGSITDYLLSLADGGSRHKQFIQSIHGVSSAAHFVYEGFRLVVRITGLATKAVGGLGNALKIVATLWAVNKIYSWQNAIRNSALGSKIFGDAACASAGRGTKCFGAFGRSIPTGRVGRLKAALNNLPNSLKIGITLVIGYELEKHFAGFLAKKLGLSTAHGNVGGDTTSFLGIPGLGSGSVAEDKLRKGNPFPPGTGLYDAFQAGRSGKGKHITFPDGSTEDIGSSRAETAAYERGVRARRAAEKGAASDAGSKALTKSAAADGAAVGNSFGDAAAAAIRAKRQTIRHELAQVTQDLAAARAEAAKAIQAAFREAQQAEREAILSAKSNLNSLGSSLADQIGQLIDKQSERQAQAPSGPLARRLHRLEELIHQGKATPALIAEAHKVEQELNEQSNKQSGDTGKRKERITRRLADLTDELNTGKISLARFNREVTRLLRREGISYKAAGKVLGISFADGFREALKELRQQAAAIANTPAKLRRLGTGFDQQIIRPAQVIREQAKNIAAVEREQKKRIGELVTKQEALLKEARAVGLTAKQQRHTIIDELKKGNGHREKANRDRPKKPGPAKPLVDLTDTLLKRVAAVGHDELVATRKQNDLIRSVIRADQVETAVIRKGDQTLIRGDERARAQRTSLLRAEQHQTRVLERMLQEETKQTALLREERKRPGIPDRVKNPRRASDEAAATATHNLLGS